MIIRRRRLGVPVAMTAVAALLASGCSGPGSATGSRVAGSPAPAAPSVAASPSVTGPSAAPPPVSSRPSPSTASSTAPRTAPGTIRLRFTGDMLPNDEVQAQAARNAGGSGYDFAPMLAPVAPLIADADWSICHQETVLSADNSTLAGYPAFSAPFQLARDEKAAGYDACSTASNHTVDRGSAGVRSTLDVLDRFGLRHSGSARSADEQTSPPIYDVRGVRVGHLSATYGTNGIRPPTPYAVNLIDAGRIRRDAAALRARGAQIVVVSLHFGEQYRTEPTAYQEQVVADVMAGPEVDLIVGHHAHVVQPVEQLPDGRWVVWGLGNFLTAQRVPGEASPPRRDGVIVEVRFAPVAGGRYAVDRVGYVPTVAELPGSVVQVAADLSRRRTEAALRSRGAGLVDLTPS